MKILILGPNGINRKNWGHQLFLNTFARHHKCVYWGPDHINYDSSLSIPQVIEKYGKPDLILTYLAKRCYPFKGLDKLGTIKRAHIEIDFFNKTGKYRGQFGRPEYGKFYNEYKPQIIFAPVTTVLNGLIEHNICDKNFLLPFSVDSRIYKPLKLKKVIDVMAVFSSSAKAYPNRQKIQRIVQRMRGVKSVTRRILHSNHVNIINQSKIIITSNNLWQSLSMRYTEVLACQSFLLADKPEDFERFGFVDGNHLVIYNDLNDMVDKIKYYLSHNREREKIAKSGRNFVLKYHTTDVRVKQFTDIVRKELFNAK